MTGAALREMEQQQLDLRKLRACLGQYGTGVTVITTEQDGLRAGIAANSFASLSLDPPLILWSLDNASRSLSVFQRSSHFAINVLGSRQIDIARIFSSKAADKFSGSSWSRGIGGSPLLDGAIACFQCSVESRQQAGDHVLFIGRVLDFKARDGNPLLFSQGKYAVSTELATIPTDAREGVCHISELQVTSIWRLIFFAHHALMRNFETYRQRTGYTAAHGEVITQIAPDRGISRQDLARRVFMSPQVMNDRVADLIDRAHVHDEQNLLYLTELGMELRTRIAREIVEYETEQLAGATEDEIVCTRSLLSRLVSRNFPAGWSAL